MLVNSRLGGDEVELTVRRAKDGTETVIGPFALLDAPWTEQTAAKEGDVAPSFPLPVKPEGR
jgi:hypothetical protein